MQICWFCVVLLLLGIAPAARADLYPFPGKPFVQNGVVMKVDSDRDRIIFQGDNGQRYTLDTSDSGITLPDGSHAAMTPDLSPGMRIHVSGKLLSPGIAEVSQMRVLSLGAATRPKPLVEPPTTPKIPSGPDDPNAITLRGTVEAIDTHLGAFVVKIKDHTRTILLADDTDLSGLGTLDPQAFPIKPGDRVTVAGTLQPNGKVLAGAIGYSRDIAFPTPILSAQSRVLFGQVSSQSNRYASRDIKIRIANGREVKIKVPRGIPIRRDAQPISIHDLQGSEWVRVIGLYAGSDFEAERIDTVRSPENPRRAVFHGSEAAPPSFPSDFPVIGGRRASYFLLSTGSVNDIGIERRSTRW